MCWCKCALYDTISYFKLIVIIAWYNDLLHCLQLPLSLRVSWWHLESLEGSGWNPAWTNGNRLVWRWLVQGATWMLSGWPIYPGWSQSTKGNSLWRACSALSIQKWCWEQAPAWGRWDCYCQIGFPRQFHAMYRKNDRQLLVDLLGCVLWCPLLFCS